MPLYRLSHVHLLVAVVLDNHREDQREYRGTARFVLPLFRHLLRGLLFVSRLFLVLVRVHRSQIDCFWRVTEGGRISVLLEGSFPPCWEGVVLPNRPPGAV